jgi:hypothetical protein
VTTATTGTFPRRRARIAAAAAGLAAALLLSACSDGGGSGSEEATASPSATETAATGGGSGSTGRKSELEGSWLATTDGKAVALIVTGEQAAVFGTGGDVCSGTAKEESGMRMIRLKCTGAEAKGQRTVGMVDSVSRKSLTITWEGSVGQEKYRKADGAELPSGPATAGS